MHSTRSIRGLCAAAALAAVISPLAASADPGTVVADGVVEATDLATDITVGLCNTKSFTPKPLQIVQTAPPTGSTSTWYDESGGLTYTSSSPCRGGVKAVACLTDESAPQLYKKYGDTRATACLTTTSTTHSATSLKHLKVPYLGADAGGVRPYGRVTLYMAGYRIGSNGKYPKVPNECQQYTYVVNPPANVMYPVEAGPCGDAAAYVLADVVAEASAPQNE